MAGRLAGIARHGHPTGPMETLNSAIVTAAAGVEGDCRGALAATKPGRKRQVSLIETDCWQATLADIRTPIGWWQARRNLLVDGLQIPRVPGVRVQIGASLVVEVTGECDPCDRMEALHPGLRAAMTPDWRGGLLVRVIEGGEIAVGEEIRII